METPTVSKRARLRRIEETENLSSMSVCNKLHIALQRQQQPVEYKDSVFGMQHASYRASHQSWDMSWGMF
jgi:hypothetical protein